MFKRTVLKSDDGQVESAHAQQGCARPRQKGAHGRS